MQAEIKHNSEHTEVAYVCIRVGGVSFKIHQYGDKDMIVISKTGGDEKRINIEPLYPETIIIK